MLDDTELAQPLCRVCFCGTEPALKASGHLISPCNCTGSVRYIHLHCLRTWQATSARCVLQVQQSARGLTCLSLARPRSAHVQNLWISQCSCLCASALWSHCSQGTAAESQHQWLQKLSCPHMPHGSQQPACSPSTTPVRPILCVYVHPNSNVTAPV